jgi:hypothetical protein
MPFVFFGHVIDWDKVRKKNQKSTLTNRRKKIFQK